MEKYRVTLTLEERTELERLVSVGRAAARKLTHARILLLADALHGEEHADEAIVTALGASPKTVARVRKRLVTEGIEAALTPRPQPLRPGKIKMKGDVEQQLVELACTAPPRGRCHWTLPLLTDALVVLGLVEAIRRETGRQARKKNDIQPWIVQTWCVPPQADAEFVWRMEDVIQTDFLPYDPAYPVIGFDEAWKQLFGEVRPCQPPGPGMRARLDYAYERKGVCHQLMRCEPLRGWRHVQGTERRTRRDYAACVRELVDGHSPRAKQIRLIQDNLNTHDGASFSEACSPEEARRILHKLEFRDTPKHGSWLNMAETEINIMNSQGLDRRLDSQSRLADEGAAWESERNARKARIHWTFTLATARRKLRKLYPSIED